MILGIPTVTNPAQAADVGARVRPRSEIVERFDDLFEYDATATVGNYLEGGDAGTVGLTDADNGVLSIATGATLDNERFTGDQKKVFRFMPTVRMSFEARVEVTEGATNKASFIVGLTDTAGANHILDYATIGLAASWSGALFVKLAGALNLAFATSLTTVPNGPTTLQTIASGTWYTLRFEYDPQDGVTGKITPYVNGVAYAAKTIVIADYVAKYMAFMVNVKNGVGTSVETILVDYWQVVKER
jgi:hypothetical protein